MNRFTIALIIASLHLASVVHAECTGSETPEPPPATTTMDLAQRLGVSTYDPIYFIVGNNGGLNSKFQISFKYSIFREGSWISDCLPVPSHIYLSYTQTSLWDLHERSSPFKDTSYKPRLFYARDDIWTSDSKHWQLGLEGGFAHESNGKADPDSRSVNMGYVRPSLSYRWGSSQRVYVAPMVVSYVDKLENENIADYRGHVDFLMGYGSGNDGEHNLNAWALLRKGDRKKYGSVEVNLAIPFRYLSGGRMNGWLLTQYFSGWSEGIMDYTRKDTAQFRAGFAILVQ